MQTTLPVPSGVPTLVQRVGIEHACERNIPYREAIRRRCADDAAFFMSAVCYTFDPRPTAPYPDLPFILYDFQVDTVRWLDARLASLEDGIIEKSRDMGVTWVTLAWILHGWLFKPGFQALIGSRKEDLVDNGTRDSHFGKLVYLIEKLPGWMLPRGFKVAEHRMKLKLINPENGNVIVGESANAQFSRQGRYTVVLFDEAAFWEDLESSWRAAGQATTCRIAISTPNGMNAFGRLRFMQREDGAPMYPVLTLHVKLHPDKDDEWIERQRNRMTVEDFAQEIDISYQRSVKGVVYPEWATIPTGHYPYIDGWPLFIVWDFGVGDDTAISWWARNPETGKLRVVDCYSNRGKAIDFYIPIVLGYIPPEIGAKHEYGSDELQQIGRHSLWPTGVHYGDPAGKQRSSTTASSVIDELRKYNIFVYTNDKARDFRTRKGATELGLREIEGINIPACGKLHEAMLNAKFPERNPDSRSTSESNLPVHDWTSHFRTTVEYLFVNLPPLFRRLRPDPTRRKMRYEAL